MLPNAETTYQHYLNLDHNLWDALEMLSRHQRDRVNVRTDDDEMKSLSMADIHRIYNQVKQQA